MKCGGLRHWLFFVFVFCHFLRSIGQIFDEEIKEEKEEEREREVGVGGGGRERKPRIL